MIRPKRFAIRKFLGAGMMIFVAVLVPMFAQKAAQERPLVIAGTMPLYPRTALLVHIHGVAKIRVTTDGKKVSALVAEGGPPMLVKAAKDNILTWEFAEHKPTTFVTTFEYLIDEPATCSVTNGTSVLHMPLEVRVSANDVQTCDPAVERRQQ
jgi:hypothetical protein